MQEKSLSSVLTTLDKVISDKKKYREYLSTQHGLHNKVMVDFFKCKHY